MSGPVAVLDACTLVPVRLATTLLWLAEAGLFQPLWSEPILDEVQRNLPEVGVSPEQAGHRVAMMRDAFGAEAIVTFNLKDFPDQAGAEYGIAACHPDGFLARLLSEHADTVIATLRRETTAFSNPVQTLAQFLATLVPTVPTFADRAAGILDGPPRPTSDDARTSQD